MKRNLLFISLAMFICTVGFSQANANPNAPRKGYYAIGNNAAKYPQGTLVVANGGGYVTKGYFAQKKYQEQAEMNTANSKNNQQVFAVSNNPVPHSKGYYSQKHFQQLLSSDMAGKGTSAAKADSISNP